MTQQNELPNVDGPGVGKVRIPEIDAQARIYCEHRDARMAAGRLEIDAKDKLIELLHAHEKKIGRNGKGKLYYEFDNITALLEPTDEKLTVKVKVEGDEDPSKP
jgi:hypothetical protein